MSETISLNAIRQLVDQWIGEGRQVAGPRTVKAAGNAPRHDLIQYAALEKGEQLRLDGFIHPANSIKEFFLPRHETLYGYVFKGKKIELTSGALPTGERVIVGARPCDAASLPVLDHIFNWDTRDESYNRRRELTTVVTLSCREHDARCFCTSVGSGPGDTRGSDVMLVELGNGEYEVRCLTDKGRRLMAGHTTASSVEGQIAQGPAEQFDLAAVGDFLARGYEQPEWEAVSRRCLGCGACAYTCPTCHCFDIVDEGNAAGGTRVRNWDACQFAMFTLHASGHNPRNVQSQRQRQRIYHKFQIYPEKFGEVLCTGCGNCTRNCPAGLGVLSVLKTIAAKK